MNFLSMIQGIIRDNGMPYSMSLEHIEPDHFKKAEGSIFSYFSYFQVFIQLFNRTKFLIYKRKLTF